MPRTLLDKLWDAHVIAPERDGVPAVLYIDLHLIHEVTSPQAFAELEARGLKLHRAERTKATLDHSTPTLPADANGNQPYISDAALRIQAYRNLAEITTSEQLQRLRRDWRDRFGKWPEPVDNLFLLSEIRLSAGRARVSRVEVREGKLMLSRRGDFILVGGKFPRLSSGRIDQHLGEVLALIKSL